MKGLMYNRQTDSLMSDVLRAKKKMREKKIGSSDDCSNFRMILQRNPKF